MDTRTAAAHTPPDGGSGSPGPTGRVTTGRLRVRAVKPGEASHSRVMRALRSARDTRRWLYVAVLVLLGLVVVTHREPDYVARLDGNIPTAEPRIERPAPPDLGLPLAELGLGPKDRRGPLPSKGPQPKAPPAKSRPR